MLEKNTVITLDNDKNYTVLRTKTYKDNEYALITDFQGENNVVLVEKDNEGIVISLIEDKKEEELIVNLFLKDSIIDLENFQKNSES